jgi:hypothetical protein
MKYENHEGAYIGFGVCLHLGGAICFGTRACSFGVLR